MKSLNLIVLVWLYFLQIPNIGAEDDFVFSIQLLRAIEWTQYQRDHSVPSRGQFVQGAEGDQKNKSLFRLLWITPNAHYIEVFENGGVLKYRYNPARGYMDISHSIISENFIVLLSSLTEKRNDFEYFEAPATTHRSTEVVLLGGSDRDALTLLELKDPQLHDLFMELRLISE